MKFYLFYNIEKRKINMAKQLDMPGGYQWTDSVNWYQQPLYYDCTDDGSVSILFTVHNNKQIGLAIVKFQLDPFAYNIIPMHPDIVIKHETHSMLYIRGVPVIVHTSGRGIQFRDTTDHQHKRLYYNDRSVMMAEYMLLKDIHKYVKEQEEKHQKTIDTLTSRLNLIECSISNISDKFEILINKMDQLP